MKSSIAIKNWLETVDPTGKVVHIPECITAVYTSEKLAALPTLWGFCSEKPSFQCGSECSGWQSASKISAHENVPQGGASKPLLTRILFLATASPTTSNHRGDVRGTATGVSQREFEGERKSARHRAFRVKTSGNCRPANLASVETKKPQMLIIIQKDTKLPE